MAGDDDKSGKGDETKEPETKVSVGKDLKEAHTSYPAAMRRRQDIHDSLIEADYRRGYVSMDESPGQDNAPLITHRISYSHVSDKGKRCELVQTFRDHKGAGDTVLTHEKRDKDNKLTGAAVPSSY